MKNTQNQIKNTLVTNIKRHRAKCKLTQEQAAEMAGITAKYWQRLEMTSQTDLPSLPMLYKIAEVLKTTPSKLLKKP